MCAKLHFDQSKKNFQSRFQKTQKWKMEEAYKELPIKAGNENWYFNAEKEETK